MRNAFIPLSILHLWLKLAQAQSPNHGASILQNALPLPCLILSLTGQIFTEHQLCVRHRPLGFRCEQDKAQLSWSRLQMVS